MDKPKPVGNDGNIFRCPMCRAYLPHANVATFPFCSDRCRLQDLNNWMEGNYSVSRPMDPGEEEETPQPPPSPPR